MHRRELFIVAGVLVPFAALVVAGWLFTKPAPAHQPPDQLAAVPADSGVIPPLQVRTASSRPSPSGPLTVTVALAPGDAGAIDAGAGADDDPALAAPLRAVEPQVRLCFADRTEHVRERVTLRVSFRPTPDAGFDQVRIESGGLPDPTFAACVEDVFAEMHFQPSGHETFQRATHTFVFDPPRR